MWRGETCTQFVMYAFRACMFVYVRCKDSLFFVVIRKFIIYIIWINRIYLCMVHARAHMLVPATCMKKELQLFWWRSYCFIQQRTNENTNPIHLSFFYATLTNIFPCAHRKHNKTYRSPLIPATSTITITKKRIWIENRIRKMLIVYNFILLPPSFAHFILYLLNVSVCARYLWLLLSIVVAAFSVHTFFSLFQ